MRANPALRCLLLIVIASAANSTAALATELIRISESNYTQVVPTGKEVDAIIGDFVLRNNQVCAVLAQPVVGRQANMTVRGVAGMLIDFTRRHHGSDQLSCFYPGAGRYLFEQSASLVCTVDGQAIDLATADTWSGTTITFALAGTPVAEDGTAAALTWSLADGQQQLSYRVTLTNNGTAPVELPSESSLRCDGNSFVSNVDEDLKLFTVNDRYFGQCYGFMLDDAAITSDGAGANCV